MRSYGVVESGDVVSQHAIHAIETGALLVEHEDELTIEARAPWGETIFRAIAKAEDVWIVVYNERFFPKP